VCLTKDAAAVAAGAQDSTLLLLQVLASKVAFRRLLLAGDCSRTVDVTQNQSFHSKDAVHIAQCSLDQAGRGLQLQQQQITIPTWKKTLAETLLASDAAADKLKYCIHPRSNLETANPGVDLHWTRLPRMRLITALLNRNMGTT
jgi:hypothetical protein